MKLTIEDKKKIIEIYKNEDLESMSKEQLIDEVIKARDASRLNEQKKVML